ncbi:MAG: regulator of replication initiation timing [Saprospiraceae bacterium]
MKAIEQKIEELESTIKASVSYISHIKKYNTILLDENKRLQKELDQLKNIIERRGSESTTANRSIVSQAESEINIELLKKELDGCINELEAYIVQSKN